MPAQLDNAAPQVHAKAARRVTVPTDLDEDVADAFDAREIFDLIRDINDPEHPLTLEQLNVVEEDKITVLITVFVVVSETASWKTVGIC